MDRLQGLNFGQVQRGNPLLQAKKLGPSIPEVGADQSFSERLKEAMEDVDQVQRVADKKLEMMASGKDVDIAGTMIALQEADISIKTISAFRDKISEGYKSLINMAI